MNAIEKIKLRVAALTHVQKCIASAVAGLAVASLLFCPLFACGVFMLLPAPHGAVAQKVPGEQKKSPALPVLKRADVKEYPGEDFRVGWRGALWSYRGYRCVVRDVLGPDRAIVRFGRPNIVAGWNDLQAPMLISNVDTSKMFEGGEVHEHDQLFEDVYEITETTKIGSRTMLHLRRIAIVEK